MIHKVNTHLQTLRQIHKTFSKHLLCMFLRYAEQEILHISLVADDYIIIFLSFHLLVFQRRIQRYPFQV